MKYRFITVVHFLKLDKPNCRIPLGLGMVSNKDTILKDILNYNNRLAVGTLGVHSIDEFIDSTFYIVDGVFDKSITKEKVDSYGTMMTFALLRQIQLITNNLWLIRDNSIYIRDGFLFAYNKLLDDGVTFKASLSTINTKASGLREDVFFSKAEIEGTANGVELITLDDVFSGSDYRNATQQQYFKSAKMGRKAIASFYVFHARASAALPIKVLMYITAMEALVSTFTAELSHQVAERVATLLGKESKERMAIYSEIKKGYDYRSKTAHGEALKGNENDLSNLLVNLDEYLRRLMSFDTPFDLNEKQINEFFLNRIMA